MFRQVVDALLDFVFVALGYALTKRLVEWLERTPAARQIFRPDIPEIGSSAPVLFYAFGRDFVERTFNRFGRIGRFIRVQPFLLGSVAWGGARLLKNAETRFKFNVPITAFEQP